VKSLSRTFALTAGLVALGLVSPDTASAWDFPTVITTTTPTTTTSTWTTTPIFLPDIVITWTPTWKCRTATGAVCSDAQMADPSYKQIVVLPTGFSSEERNGFWTDFDKVINMMTHPSAAGSWSVQKKDKLLFVGYFLAGGPLGTDTAAFGGIVAQHPIRGHALSLSQRQVYDQLGWIRATSIPRLRPFGVAVLFNTFQTGITANAAPPSFVQQPYGICKMTREDLGSPYIAIHELAHAALNFLDEYREPGLQDLSIKQLDLLTPLAIFDGSWNNFVAGVSDLLGIYDYNISEILANNGNVNVTTTRYPATVSSGGYAQYSYDYEGGMFFGRGTYHMRGNNLMNSNYAMRGPDDGFGYGHTTSQQGLLDNAFGAGAPRANDRLRNAGPINNWPLVFGNTTQLFLFDGDKLNHFHPTKSYDVEVGWYERQWRTCYAGGWFPYPCYNDVWRSARKTVYPQARSLDFSRSWLNGAASLVQDVMCGLGITELPTDGGAFRVCDQSLATISAQFLPTTTFWLPYQDVAAPADQWFTNYYWRFRTFNGTAWSGYTGWSSFYRSF
jgi:hypothetical protein